jgi:diaminopimelate epimerase
MSMRLPFVKMEGAGNDYVYVDGIAQTFPVERAAELAQQLADRHRGVGGDGLIVLLRSQIADVRMMMWNADGSRGAMCGNGLRCLAALARERGHVARDVLTVETDAGVRRVELLRAGQAVVGARAEMGNVTVNAEPETVAVLGRDLQCHRADAGNPHAVVFLDGDPEAFPVGEIGKALQRHAAFPGGVNVEFVQVAGDGSLRMRVFERGSGETLACGSGAVAAALCAVRTGRTGGDRIAVHLRGGDLQVDIGASGLVLEGPVRTVFRGELDLPDVAERPRSGP